MAANVATTLELGLREAAETVWARKVLLEVLGAGAPAGPLLAATHAHGKAVGRAEGTALALVLVLGNYAGAEHPAETPDLIVSRLLAVGQASGELVTTVIAEVGDTVWDRARIEVAGLHTAIVVALGSIPPEVSWSAASTAAALRPLYPKSTNPRGPQ